MKSTRLPERAVSTEHKTETAQAEFIRLPKTGTRDPYYGLSRSTWNTLILPCEANGHRPPIRSVSLKKRGAVRGVRMIDADAAKAYFHSIKSAARTAGGKR